MMQSLFSLCLLTTAATTAPGALANTYLRGTRDLQIPYNGGVQIDPLLLEDNQVAYFVSFQLDIKAGAPRNPSPVDLSTFNRLATDWVTQHVMKPVLDRGSLRQSAVPFGPGEFALYPYYGQGGCLPGDVAFSQSYGPRGSPVGSYVLATMTFKCQFERVDSPADVVTFVQELEDRGTQAESILLGTLTASTAPLISQAVAITTTSLPAPSWQSIGNKVRNDNFVNGYVLPFVITWSFNTAAQFATQNDYSAMEQATTDWLEQNWDSFYNSAYPGSDKFARRTVDVMLKYSSFSPAESMYSQSLTLGVEILVGANNITDVPSVTRYTTSMQLFYPITNFTRTLDNYLDEDSAFRNNMQTTYAITPTYQVTELSESKNKTDYKEDIDMVNYAVVGVDMAMGGF